MKWTYHDPELLLEDYEWLPYPDGFENCIVGVITHQKQVAFLLDTDKMVDTLMERDDLSRPDAWSALSRLDSKGAAYWVDAVKGYGDD